LHVWEFLLWQLFLSETESQEIGIRNVNGAKISEIVTLINKDLIKWVIIAFVIANYRILRHVQWLGNFAYKTNLCWWIFALTGVLLWGIAC
jgi:putative ABC transport system permease protein